MNKKQTVIYEMSNNKVNLRHFSLYKFLKNSNAAAAIKSTCNVQSISAVNVRNTYCQLWFSKFRSGDFSLTDKHVTSKLMQIYVKRT